MKTHTTTASGLLRSLALIPVLALLIISCGQEEIVEEPVQIEVVEEPMDVQNSKYVNVIEPNESKQFYIDTQNTSGYLSIDGDTHHYVIDEDEFQVYDINGNKIDLKQLGYEIIGIEEVEVEIEEVEIVDEEALNNEFVPQPPLSPLEFIKRNKGDMTYFMDDTKINHDQAVSFIEATGEKGVSMVQKRDGTKYIVIMMTDEKRKLLPRLSSEKEKGLKQALNSSINKIGNDINTDYQSSKKNQLSNLNDKTTLEFGRFALINVDNPKVQRMAELNRKRDSAGTKSRTWEQYKLWFSMLPPKSSGEFTKKGVTYSFSHPKTKTFVFDPEGNEVDLDKMTD